MEIKNKKYIIISIILILIVIVLLTIGNINNKKVYQIGEEHKQKDIIQEDNNVKLEGNITTSEMIIVKQISSFLPTFIFLTLGITIVLILIRAFGGQREI